MSQTRPAKEIFADAIELKPFERAEFVRSACGGDADLLDEVRQLIRTHDSAGRFMDAPTISPAAASAGAIREGPGTVIGRYRLLQAIGEGGFGVVFMAEQREPVSRRVALKIIKPGMDTAQVVARFEAERQALAVMDHPNIAKVLDAGETDTGRPYFVMELVKGEPITEFCDQNSLPIAERLELFTQVCQAVQHAHIKGIIHRDINPRNVLVSMQDGRALARVIDFGIAKAIDRRLTEKTVFTEFRQFIGTPEYMSPEQAGGGLDIDTRTDVYSLGVLLYELLTGSTPFDPQRLRSAAYDELQRIIREDEPPKPSTRLSESKVTLQGVAARRRVDPTRLGTMIRGELDWIVLKALEKDRSRRYDSPGNLAVDLQRYMAGRTVSAAPPSAVYRVRKFVGRHRVGVGAGALITLALVVGLGTAIWQAGIAARERDAARASAATALKAQAQAGARLKEIEQIAGFQASQLKGLDAAAMGARLRDDLLADAKASMERAKLPAAEIQSKQEQLRTLLSDANLTNIALKALDETIFVRALKAVDDQFKDNPEVRAGLLLRIADTLTDLGLYDRATAPLAEGLAIRSRLLGEDHPETLDAMVNMGYLLRAQGKLPEAEAICREALERCRRVHGNDHPSTLTAMGNLGIVLQSRGKLAEAEPLYLEVLAGRRRVPGDERQLLIAVGNVGFLLQAQGKNLEAEPYFKEAMDRSRTVMGEEDPYTLKAISNYGSVLQQQSRWAEAEPYLREALEKRRHVLGADHPDTLRSLANLGVLLNTSHRPAEAEPFFLEALERSRRRWSPDHPFVIQAMGNLGQLLHWQGRLSEADPYLSEALERDRRVLSVDHPDTLISMCRLAELRFDQENLPAAEQLFREAVAGFERRQGPDNAITAKARAQLGDVLAAEGRYTEAQAALLDAERALQNDRVPSRERYRYCVERLVSLYSAWEKAEPGHGYDANAAQWRTKLPEAGGDTPGGSAPPGR